MLKRAWLKAEKRLKNPYVLGFLFGVMALHAFGLYEKQREKTPLPLMKLAQGFLHANTPIFLVIWLAKPLKKSEFDMLLELKKRLDTKVDFLVYGVHCPVGFFCRKPNPPHREFLKQNGFKPFENQIWLVDQNAFIRSIIPFNPHWSDGVTKAALWLVSHQ